MVFVFGSDPSGYHRLIVIIFQFTLGSCLANPQVVQHPQIPCFPTALRPLTNDIFPSIFNQGEILIRPSLLLSCGVSNKIRGIECFPLLSFRKITQLWFQLISSHYFLTIEGCVWMDMTPALVYELNLNFCFEVLLVLSHYLFIMTRHT